MLSGQTTSNQWIFYSIDISDTSSLDILVKETSSQGYIWIYVAKTYPTIRSYLYSDTETNTNIHRISIDFTDDESTTFQIGIYGNPYALPDQTINYQIVAWAPDF